ncbi:MAG: tol-pal system-associated acyl-CoA thioesterase [Alphaproteobacteria bacterium]
MTGDGVPEGWIADGVHVLPLRVYYEDTDAGGIVYYANYLKFAERARTEMMRCLGAEHGGLMREDGISFAVRHCEASFVSPARLDDVIEVRTKLAHVRGASMCAEQSITRGDQALADITVRLACRDTHGRPARLPARLRKTLATLT